MNQVPTPDARERWQQAPLMAGLRRGAGAVLWVAASPGARGYERFPYLLHALADLGFEPPFEARRLWAFFDSSYRMRADLDYLARRWRKSGIAALHVAAWHYFEPDPRRDEYLQQLIRVCHRNAILVYARLNDRVSAPFYVDTGAADVVVPAEVAEQDARRVHFEQKVVARKVRIIDQAHLGLRTAADQDGVVPVEFEPGSLMRPFKDLKIDLERGNA